MRGSGIQQSIDQAQKTVKRWTISGCFEAPRQVLCWNTVIQSAFTCFDGSKNSQIWNKVLSAQSIIIHYCLLSFHTIKRSSYFQNGAILISFAIGFVCLSTRNACFLLLYRTSPWTFVRMSQLFDFRQLSIFRISLLNNLFFKFSSKMYYIRKANSSVQFDWFEKNRLIENFVIVYIESIVLKCGGRTLSSMVAKFRLINSKMLSTS